MLYSEELIGKALFFRYADRKNESLQIINQLLKTNPTRFDQYDPALIYLLTDLQADQKLVNRLANAYIAQKHIQPYVLTDLAGCCEKKGDAGQAIRFFKELADAKGFKFWWLSANAARKTGGMLLKAGKETEGRQYYWKAVNDLKIQYADDNAIREVIAEMNKLAVKP